MIEGRGLSKKFTNQLLFENLNIEAKPGDFVGIVGRTGCGKSTLLNILSGYDFCDKGDVLVDGENYKKFTTKDVNNFRKKKIAFLFQEYNLLEDLTVFENLKLSVNLDKSENKKIDEYLNKLNLYELKHKKVSKLSGGEKQRIAFLRSIIKDFDILICDEPTGNLDDTNAKIVLNLIKEECRNKIVIMVTHKMSIANEFFNKLYQYNKKDKTFDKVFDENIGVKRKKLKSSNKKVSIVGVIRHALTRIRVNLFFNVLIIFLISMFLFSYSAASVLNEGMFREIQIDSEKKLLPLDEVVLSSSKGNIEDLKDMEDVNEAVVKYSLFDNYKLLGHMYSLGEDTEITPLNSEYIINVNIVNEGEVKYSFLVVEKIHDRKRKIDLTYLVNEDDFVYSDLIVGSYPKEGEVLIDPLTAIMLLGSSNFSKSNYFNNKLTAKEIYDAISRQYLEFYEIRTVIDETTNGVVQNIHSVKFKIAGIIDVGRASKHIKGIYAYGEAFEKISNMPKSLRHKNYVVYKNDATRKTHEFFLSDLEEHYKYDGELMDLYSEAYNRVKVVVDYNLLLAQISSFVFFLGFIILILYIFSQNKYEIAVYRSLGYSHFITTFVLSFNYILFIVLGSVISYILNRVLVSKLLDYDQVFIKVFDKGILVSSCILIVAFFSILLSYVIRYSKKSINSII